MCVEGVVGGRGMFGDTWGLRVQWQRPNLLPTACCPAPALVLLQLYFDTLSRCRAILLAFATGQWAEAKDAVGAVVVCETASRELPTCSPATVQLRLPPSPAR